MFLPLSKFLLNLKPAEAGRGGCHNLLKIITKHFKLRLYGPFKRGNVENWTDKFEIIYFLFLVKNIFTRLNLNKIKVWINNFNFLFSNFKIIFCKRLFEISTVRLIILWNNKTIFNQSHVYFMLSKLESLSLKLIMWNGFYVHVLCSLNCLNVTVISLFQILTWYVSVK